MVNKDYDIWIKNYKKHKKFILNYISEKAIIYFSERSEYRGHFMYRLDKINQTCEVLPIYVKSKYLSFYKNIHIIKYESFMQNKINFNLKISTYKLYNHYKTQYIRYGSRKEK